MIKFHHRLLLLLCTITIISFIGLGAILHHTIYQILSDTQTRELNHLSENIVNLNKRNKQADIQRIAQNQNLVVKISENEHVLYQTGNQHQINHTIDNALILRILYIIKIRIRWITHLKIL